MHRWSRGRGVPLAVVSDLDRPVAEVYGAGLVLVRPDQHIAWLGDQVGHADADRVLDEALLGF